MMGALPWAQSQKRQSGQLAAEQLQAVEQPLHIHPSPPPAATDLQGTAVYTCENHRLTKKQITNSCL